MDLESVGFHIHEFRKGEGDQVFPCKFCKKKKKKKIQVKKCSEQKLFSFFLFLSEKKKSNKTAFSTEPLAKRIVFDERAYFKLN